MNILLPDSGCITRLPHRPSCETAPHVSDAMSVLTTQEHALRLRRTAEGVKNNITYHALGPRTLVDACLVVCATERMPLVNEVGK